MLVLCSVVILDVSIVGKFDFVDYYFFDVCEVGCLG